MLYSASLSLSLLRAPASLHSFRQSNWLSGARPHCVSYSQRIKWSTYAKRTRRAPLIVLTWKLFFICYREDEGGKKLNLNFSTPQTRPQKNEQQEADSARDELAATSSRDGPAFLELCDRLREQR